MILVYDEASLPKGMTVESWYNIYNYFGIIVYDSTLGNKPTIEEGRGNFEQSAVLLDLNDGEMLARFKDITGMKI